MKLYNKYPFKISQWHINNSRLSKLTLEKEE